MRKRLIPSIFLKNGLIIRSEDFKIHQIIGNPITEVDRYNEWAVDEIIYIDISKDINYDFRRDDHKYKDIVKNKFELVKEVSKVCFVPLAFGGGIRTIEDIRKILKNGADKVILNTILFTENDFLEKAVSIFGSQALVACVDYIGDYVYHSHATVNSGKKVLDWCEELEKRGIGEIVLNSVERDGKAIGYDIQIISHVVENSEVPIIALGGAGDYFDFIECFQEANPSAVAAGNLFHFKELSYYYGKQSLLSTGINIRQEWESLKVL